MYPILLKFGPITLYTYGLAMAIAFMSAIALLYHEARREGLETAKLADFGFFVIISGIIGARLLYIVINPSEYLSHPLKILMIWEGGLVFYGGILGAMGTTIYLLKRYNLPFWQMADILAPSLVLAQAIGRIGCFMAGCCYGRNTHLPWAVTFNNPNTLAPMGVSLHPTQLYHSFANITIFFILIFILKKKRHFTGQVFCLYLCLYPLGRFFIEFFRSDSFVNLLGLMNLKQGISLVMLIGGLYLYWCRNTSAKSKKTSS